MTPSHEKSENGGNPISLNYPVARYPLPATGYRLPVTRDPQPVARQQLARHQLARHQLARQRATAHGRRP